MSDSRREFISDMRRYLFAALSVIVLMAFFVTLLLGYLKRSIHNERKTYLSVQTKTAASLILETLDQYSDYVQMCRSIIAEDLLPGEDLYAYMDEAAEKLYLNGARLILVDQTCTWYGSAHTTGRITLIDEYESSSPTFSTYITTGVDVSIESIVYRARLPEPISVEVDGSTTEITNCAIIYYLDSFSEQLSDAFPYSGNRFILDHNGLMLYKSFDFGFLMDGTNVFSKYTRANFLYNDTGSSLLDEIRSGDISVGEMQIKDTSYFICTAPLGFNGWYICYVLESGSLNVGAYLASMVLYVTGICLLFAIAILFAVLMLVRARNNRKQAEAQQAANALLEQASRAKSDFLSNMSHDIRTPINGIMGMTLLAQKEDNPPKTQDCLQKIDSASRHLLSLVNDVLDMSSIESGKVVITCKPMDSMSLVQNCASIVHGQMQGRRLQFLTEFETPKHPHILADELHLRQILLNLLSNAVKYTPDGGTIWFRMKEIPSDNGQVRIHFQVEDTGLGMKPEFLAHIWDRFSQEDGGSRTDYKGTGLGMAITKQYVDLMDGQITVSSEYERGSIFTVEIPFSPAEKLPEEPEEDTGNGSIRGARILLAEDNVLNMAIARELLEDEGAVITEAENGRIAFDLFMQNPPGTFDLILMDIMMPEMNGLETSRAIRSSSRNDARFIPIIAMTANAFEADIQNTRDAGMNAHLSKPIDLPAVLKTISRYYHGSDSLS